jgi:HEAT repeat protein
VPFVQATRLPRPRKAAVLEWLLRHGSATAKMAAVEGLALLDNSHAQEVVRENLDAESPEVQAWATSQLRHSALPEAFALLVERLESQHAEVRAAARHELADFDVDRVLQQVDDWSIDEAHRAGQLLLKVDLEATSKLQSELTHSAAQKRIRAARAIRRLGFPVQFATTLMALTRDADPLVRRTAAEALADLATPAAMQALERLVTDENPRVRETAIEALARNRRLVAIETASGGT